MADYRDPKTGSDIPKLKTPVIGPRKDEGPMSDDELHRIVDGLVKSAAQYVTEELSPLRAKATEYYQGKPFGNEEKGRSQYVSTDVRDGVLATLPPMLRIIFGPERVVEFRPEQQEDVAGAEQATDYVNYVFSEENNGFLVTHSVLKDGLVRKTGFFKIGWDEQFTTKSYQLENITQEQLEALGEDEEVTLTRIEPMGTAPVVPAGQDPLSPPVETPVFRVELTRKEQDGKVGLHAVPPEEIIWNREARSDDDALIVAHYTKKSKGDVIALGVDAKLVEKYGTAVSEPDSEEEMARDPHRLGVGDDEEAGEANEKTRYVEAYIRIDYDGDGIPELRKICAIGEDLHVVNNTPADFIPIYMFCPDPEPHTMTGQSYAERLMDIQKLKSSLFRSTLDSAAASIFPRTVYKHGEANLADILNTAIGAPIRTTGDPNSTVREYRHTFMPELIPLLGFCDDVIERRTGQSKGAQGLDSSALQSSTKAAVAAAVTASQQQQEMLVRIFAEQTLKPLFRGILKLLVKHQPRSRMIRLRNQWTEVDPRPWNADMDVQVNVMLGAGLVEEKIETLMAITEKQEQILGNLGPDNDIVDYKQYRDTLAEIAELRGRKDTTKYFKRITDEQLQASAQARAQQPPPPDPKIQIAQMEMQAKQQQAQMQMQLDQQQAQLNLQLEQTKMERQLQLEAVRAEREAHLEQMRAERDAMFEQQRIEMEQYRIELENDRLRDKQAADIQLAIKKMELEHARDLNEQQITADIERERNTSQAGPVASA